MTIKKRGLGRGLEALLVNVSTVEDNQVQNINNVVDNIMESNSFNDENSMCIADASHVSNAAYLLKEAESLRTLLFEFEDLLLNR